MDNDFAWFAGLFEGEGYSWCYRTKQSRQPGSYLRVGIGIGMTDKDVLDKVALKIGGHVCGPFQRKERPNERPHWRWSITSWKNLLRVVPEIRPLLGTRRGQQIDRLLAEAPQFPQGVPKCKAPVEPTRSGYAWHRRQGEPACDRCLKSYALFRRHENALRIARHAAMLTPMNPNRSASSSR